MNIQALRRLVAFLLLAVYSMTAHALTPGSGAQHFGQLADVAQIALSPDGDKIAAIVNVDGEYALLTKKIHSKNKKDSYLTSFDGTRVNWIRWVNNERLVISLYPVERFWGNSLLAQNWDTTKRIDLMRNLNRKREDQLRYFSWVLLGANNDNVESFMDDDDDHIIVSNYDKEGLNLYKINVYNARDEVIQRRKSRAGNWVVNNMGDARIAIGSRDDDMKFGEMSYRANEDSDWQIIDEWDIRVNHSNIDPVGFTDDPNKIYVVAHDERGVDALYFYDVSKKKLLEKVLPQINSAITHVVFDRHDKLESVRYADVADNTHYVDDTLRTIHQKVMQMAPGELVELISWSRDKTTFIIKVSSPQRPGDYYYYDAKKDDIRLYSKKFSAIDSAKLGQTTSLSFKNSDGMEIPVLVTVPPGIEPTNLPTVVVVHDGPPGRDYWGFNRRVQFLVSQGYAVLQVNFRGSEGFTHDYWFSAVNQFGSGILDDIAEGTQWLVKHGIADAKRICVMGYGYGGYAALQIQVRHPGLYACSVADNPITDIDEFLGPVLNIGHYQFVERYIKNDKNYDEISPYFNVEKIKSPVLLLANEWSVYENQAEYIYNKLKRHDAVTEYIWHEHDVQTQKRSVDTYKGIERFLATWLKKP